MKELLSKVIAKYLEQYDWLQIKECIEVPSNEDLGDFSLPCFIFAKGMKKSPMTIAEELKEALTLEKEEIGIEKLEVVKGYLNIFMNKSFYIKMILNEANKEQFGTSTEGVGKTICMDYSSPNIAKNFHVGHLRTTIIGNSLYKIYDKLGYKVVRINHLGDWGTQFGKLIVAYLKWSSKEAVEANGIDELLRIYVKFNEEAKANPHLQDEARSWFLKMEQGDREALTIWEWFKQISLVEFEQIYQMLGVEFDYNLGECFYMDKVPSLVKELKEKNLLKESQGANIIPLELFNMAPCLITKKDGSSIYHSRDLAAILYRKQVFHFEKCVYVTGLEQSLHFAQIFKVIELMGYDWASALVHVPYGLVRLGGAKLSTRNGTIIYAQDILKEAVNRSKEIIEQKNPALQNQEEIAKRVGIGAIIFHDLYNQRIKSVDFTWEDVLDFDGATGPYVQYTYVRAKSILRKVGEEAIIEGVDPSLLTEDISYSLVKVIAQYPEVIKEAATRYEPSVIARYTIVLASSFNRFYHDCKIVHEKEEIKHARLIVVHLTQKILKDALMLLGISCPEEM